MKILFDTDVLIDHLRGHSSATNTLNTLKETHSFSISSITYAEIEAGVQDKERAWVEKFLSFFEVFPVTLLIAKKAGQYKSTYGRSHHVLLPDALIAATAYCENIPLYTLNQKHYPMTDIQTVVPYQKS